MTEKTFKESTSFDKRTQESAKIRLKYPDRIPIILERSKDNIPQVDKKKYLVPQNITIGQFCFIIRKRINLTPDQAMFIFVNNILPPTSSLISSIYDEHVDSDGFLYIMYSGENTFG
jgi:GABA(A) receptor-associated protein